MVGNKPRALVVLEIDGEWDFPLQDVIDWVQMKLDTDKPEHWGDGRGGINYASARIVSTRLARGDMWP